MNAMESLKDQFRLSYRQSGFLSDQAALRDALRPSMAAKNRVAYQTNSGSAATGREDTMPQGRDYI
jgi:hypothetical protein